MKFVHHLATITSNNRGAIFLFLLVSLTIICIATIEGTWYESIVYLCTLLVAFVMVEFIYFKKKLTTEVWTIKKLNQETSIIILCISISILLAVIRFIIIEDFNSLTPIVLILVRIGAILFIYPVFLFIYFKVFQKYALKEIGLRFRHFWIAFPVIICFGIISWLLVPEQIQFQDIIKTYGIGSLLTLGLLTAAIPEEFTRMLLQSRLIRLFHNRSLGWFITSLIWALSHIPIFYNKSNDITNAIISSIGILPIGLFWGYLTERTKSIIPSVFIHSTNLWGLQNIF